MTILSISITAVVNLLPVSGGLGFIYLIVPPVALGVILSAVLGIPALLLTYELQDPRGHVILWTAYTAGIVWSIILAYEGWKGPLGSLAGPISIPLTLAPSGIFTVAFSLAYYRLKKGVIPVSLYTTIATSGFLSS